MKFALVFLVFFVAAINGQNTCSQLADCLQKVKQAEDACAPKVNAFDVGQLAGTRFSQCAPTLKANKQRLTELNSQRSDAVVACLKSDAENFDCDRNYFPFDKTGISSRGKRQANGQTKNGQGQTKNGQGQKNGIKQQVKDLRQCQKQAADQKKECEKLLSGCELAKMCHLCYEQSVGHDDIKRANLNILVARKKCKSESNPVFQHDDVENRDGKMPDEDDNFRDIHL